MSAYLYRLIGPGDCLLYVGVSGDVSERVRRHRSTSVFGHLIERIEIEACPSRDAALDREREAIVAESPIFNGHHNDDAAPLLLDGVGVLVHSLARSRRVALRELARGARMSERHLLRLLADPGKPTLGELSRLAKVLGTTAGAIVTEFEAAA